MCCPGVDTSVRSATQYTVEPVGRPGALAISITFVGMVDPGFLSASTGLEVLFLGGRQIRKPVFHYGPFVMNSRAELIEAMEAYPGWKVWRLPNALKPHRSSGTPVMPPTGNRRPGRPPRRRQMKHASALFVRLERYSANAATSVRRSRRSRSAPT